MTTEEFHEAQSEISNEELIKMCDKELGRLCKTGGRSFTMSVPVRISDTDMLFSLLIKRLELTIQS